MVQSRRKYSHEQKLDGNLRWRETYYQYIWLTIDDHRDVLILYKSETADYFSSYV